MVKAQVYIECLAKQCSSRYDSISSWCTLNPWLSFTLSITHAVIYAMSIYIQFHTVQDVVAHIYHTEIKNEPSHIQYKCHKDPV
jgi:hypothetical protein